EEEEEEEEEEDEEENEDEACIDEDEDADEGGAAAKGNPDAEQHSTDQKRKGVCAQSLSHCISVVQLHVYNANADRLCAN
ncbi:hypothetical protein GBA52_010624, partial [Prunus armeniaca]